MGYTRKQKREVESALGGFQTSLYNPTPHDVLDQNEVEQLLAAMGVTTDNKLDVNKMLPNVQYPKYDKKSHEVMNREEALRLSQSLLGKSDKSMQMNRILGQIVRNNPHISVDNKQQEDPLKKTAESLLAEGGTAPKNISEIVQRVASEYLLDNLPASEKDIPFNEPAVPANTTVDKNGQPLISTFGPYQIMNGQQQFLPVPESGVPTSTDILNTVKQRPEVLTPQQIMMNQIQTDLSQAGQLKPTVRDQKLPGYVEGVNPDDYNIPVKSRQLSDRLKEIGVGFGNLMLDEDFQNTLADVAMSLSAKDPTSFGYQMAARIKEMNSGSQLGSVLSDIESGKTLDQIDIKKLSPDQQKIAIAYATSKQDRIAELNKIEADRQYTEEKIKSLKLDRLIKKLTFQTPEEAFEKRKQLAMIQAQGRIDNKQFERYMSMIRLAESTADKETRREMGAVYGKIPGKTNDVFNKHMQKRLMNTNLPDEFKAMYAVNYDGSTKASEIPDGYIFTYTYSDGNSGLFKKENGKIVPINFDEGK